MKFSVSPEIRDAFPGMKIVVAVARGIDNATRNEAVEQRFNEVLASFVERWEYPNPQGHPVVAAWRRALKNAGISSNYPCAIENLVRRVLRGKGLRNINPLVDMYNALSLSCVSPIGGFDIDRNPIITLRYTEEGESFTELGAREPVLSQKGEIAYMNGEVMLSRHFVWRRAEQGKIHAGTSSVVLISEVMPEVEVGTAERIQVEFAENLEWCFGVSLKTQILYAAKNNYDVTLGDGYPAI